MAANCTNCEEVEWAGHDIHFLLMACLHARSHACTNNETRHRFVPSFGWVLWSLPWCTVPYIKQLVASNIEDTSNSSTCSNWDWPKPVIAHTKLLYCLCGTLLFKISLWCRFEGGCWYHSNAIARDIAWKTCFTLVKSTRASDCQPRIWIVWTVLIPGLAVRWDR